MRLEHELCASRMAKNGSKLLFATFKWEKNWFLGLTSGGNSPCNYPIPHSQILIHNEAVQEEGKH